MRPMHWNVIHYDFNGRKIDVFDIFGHGGFSKDVAYAYKKHKNDFDAFADKVRGALFYRFCSKCEWEVTIGAWPPSDRVPERKVDVYWQVMLNWPVFIDYVWTRCHERKRKGDK